MSSCGGRTCRRQAPVLYAIKYTCKKFEGKSLEILF
jgi:hypothetical protein